MPSRPAETQHPEGAHPRMVVRWFRHIKEGSSVTHPWLKTALLLSVAEGRGTSADGASPYQEPPVGVEPTTAPQTLGSIE